MKTTAFLSSCVLLLAIAGCVGNSPRGITYTKSIDYKIKNGFVREAAILDMVCEGDTLVLPTGTDVILGDGLVYPQLTVKKELALYAHPAKSISIKQVRHKLGIAARREGKRLVIATFGEYTAPGHGGASVSLSAIVPPTTIIDFEDGLNGRESAANNLRNADEGVIEEWTPIQTNPQIGAIVEPTAESQ